MIRIIAIGAALALFTAGCAFSPPVKPQTGQWFSITGIDYAAASIHETSSGLAGRLVAADGSPIPLRAVRRNGTTIGFTVPALGASFTGSPNADAGWRGKWSFIGEQESRQVVLTPTIAPPKHEGEFVTISGGRQMHIICVGVGSPTVVLDYGGGGTQKKDWGITPAGIAAAAKTRVCTYDRAARGVSDPGPLPRNATAAVQDLEETLEAADIAFPYVLAGHSMASYHVRLFANTRFNKVAGLVLIDPSGDNQTERFATVFPKMIELENRIMQAQASQNCARRLRDQPVAPGDALARSCGGNDPDTVDAMRSEIAEIGGSTNAALVATRRAYADLPMIVLTRGDYSTGFVPGTTPEENAAMQQVWHAMHAEMAALSTAGKQRVVDGADHFIQLDEPQAVIDAVTEVVHAARARKH